MAITLNNQPSQKVNSDIQVAFQDKLSQFKLASRPNMNIRPQHLTDELNFAGILSSSIR